MPTWSSSTLALEEFALTRTAPRVGHAEFIGLEALLAFPPAAVKAVTATLSDVVTLLTLL